MIKNLLLKVPFFRRYKELSDGGLDTLVKNLNAEGDYQNAFKYALIWMEGNCNKTSGYSHSRWWGLMLQAIKSGARFPEGKEPYDDLIRIVESDCGVAEGRLAAECLNKLALWGFNFSDHEKCVELAQRASNADSTWGESHFILGWLHLSLDKDASIGYFNNAITLDPEYLMRIEKDSRCRSYPEVIQKLRTIN